MTAKITLPNPENVKNYPADPKAVMVAARGMIRVVIRRYFWDKEKKRGCEKRDYLGYVVDNCFYSNDEYRRLFKRNGTKRLIVQPSNSDEVSTFEKMASLETKLAAEFPLYHEIAKHIGLVVFRQVETNHFLTQSPLSMQNPTFSARHSKDSLDASNAVF